MGNEILKYRNNAVTGTMDKRREALKKNELYVGKSEFEFEFLKNLPTTLECP